MSGQIENLETETAPLYRNHYMNGVDRNKPYKFHFSYSQEGGLFCCNATITHNDKDMYRLTVTKDSFEEASAEINDFVFTFFTV